MKRRSIPFDEFSSFYSDIFRIVQDYAEGLSSSSKGWQKETYQKIGDEIKQYRSRLPKIVEKVEAGKSIGLAVDSKSYGEFRKNLESAVRLYRSSGLGSKRLTANEMGFSEDAKLERAVLSKVLKRAINEGKILEKNTKYKEAAKLYSMFAAHPEIFGANISKSFTLKADIVRKTEKEPAKK